MAEFDRNTQSTGELVTYVEILGALRIGGVYAKGPMSINAPIQQVYVYDLQLKQNRSAEFAIDGAEFERQDWDKVGIGTTKADVQQLLAAHESAIKILAELYAARGLPSNANSS